MAKTALTGLVGSHPLGALAAFGLLRVISRSSQFANMRLSWQAEDDWIAVLHDNKWSDEPALRAAIITALLTHQENRFLADFLTWGEDIKVSPDKYAELLRAKADTCTPSSRETVDYLTAFGSETVTARSTPDVKPTAFHMTAGQQAFLKSAREIASSLDPTRPPARGKNSAEVRSETEKAFARALFGPWRYEDRYHSLGWDPAAEALHALSDIAPTAAGPACERAPVWLAFEALPLFPTAPVGNRLHTRAFDERSESFSWPIWLPPITVATLAGLLGLRELVVPNPPMEQLLPRGVVAVYRSACERDANGRGTLRNAVLCAGGGIFRGAQA